PFPAVKRESSPPVRESRSDSSTRVWLPHRPLLELYCKSVAAPVQLRRASGRPFVFEYWPHFTFFAALEVVVTVCVIVWVLMTKRDSTAAMAWCLVVIVVPFIGAFLFAVFGYRRVTPPLHRRRRPRSLFRRGHPPRTREAAPGSRPDDAPDQTWNRLGSLALQVNAFPVSPGNGVTLYHDTQKAFDGLLEAIAAARHHVHLEFFIVRGDATGQR